MTFLTAQPALPVRDIARSLEFYQDTLGFSVPHEEAGFAILRRDAIEIHVWLAGDENWRSREEGFPVVSGAESFIAGTGSCRIKVEGVEGLYNALQPLGVVHSNAPLTEQPWGDYEFAVLDPDGNLITFFEEIKD